MPIKDTTFIGTASARNSNERWTTDLHPNIPLEPMERGMTVLEAEQCQEDNSDQILTKT